MRVLSRGGFEVCFTLRHLYTPFQHVGCHCSFPCLHRQDLGPFRLQRKGCVGVSNGWPFLVAQDADPESFEVFHTMFFTLAGLATKSRTATRSATTANTTPSRTRSSHHIHHPRGLSRPPTATHTPPPQLPPKTVLRGRLVEGQTQEWADKRNAR